MVRVLSLGMHGEGPRVRRVVRVRLGLGLDVYVIMMYFLYTKSGY